MLTLLLSLWSVLGVAVLTLLAATNAPTPRRQYLYWLSLLAMGPAVWCLALSAFLQEAWYELGFRLSRRK